MNMLFYPIKIFGSITKNKEYTVKVTLSERQKDMIVSGGLLNYTREKAGM